jgi:hypothetical protein
VCTYSCVGREKVLGERNGNGTAASNSTIVSSSSSTVATAVGLESGS